jgi:hypothetical protein
MEEKTGWKRIGKPELLCPGIHFLLSFFYEWLILLLKPEVITVAAYAKDPSISDGLERALAYGISKSMAGFFIFLGWRLAFYVAKHWKNDRSLRRFFLFYAIGGGMLLILWPNIFERSIDNYMTYTYAIRLYPEYWHNIYTSCVYAACLMVLPHPFAITMVHWTVFIFLFAYVFYRMKREKSFRKGSHCFLCCLFLIPGIFPLITDPFRTEFYALLCIYFVATVLLDAIGQKEYSTKRMLAMAVCCAFLAVWRTEGVILGGLGFLAVVLFLRRDSLVKKTAWILGFIALFLLVSAPQKLGNQKYYGSDYSIMNSFASLRNILNAKDANLTYDGADADLSAIEAVVPMEAIQAYGDDGYRRYNSMNGNTDINQSVTSYAEGEAYVKAYYRIVLHNPIIYLRTQFGMLAQALRIHDYGYIVPYDGELSREYPGWTFPTWQYGMDDFYGTLLVRKWSDFGLRNKVKQTFYYAKDVTERFLIRIRVIPFLLIVLPLALLVIFFKECVRIWRRKGSAERSSWCFVFFIVTLLGQFAAIVLFMPVGAANYFHAFHFCSFIVCLFYFCWLKDRSNGERQES